MLPHDDSPPASAPQAFRLTALEVVICCVIFVILLAIVEPLGRHGGSGTYSFSLLFVFSQVPFVMAGAGVGWGIVDRRLAERVCPFVTAALLTFLASMRLPYIAWVLPFMWHFPMSPREITVAMAATATVCMITASVTCSLVGGQAQKHASLVH